jgi:disulfide bond formation protein DsbB
MLLDFVNKFLALGTIVSEIFILLALVYMFLPIKKNIVSEFFSKNGTVLAFATALIAMSGSLFYSNYAEFTPCVLCWFQRIFMYPEVIILGLGLIKKDKNSIDYGLVIATIGFIISVYHNYIYFMGTLSMVCTSAESCITPYVTEFGYVTIPVMSLTAFSLVILFLTYQKYYGKQ